MFKFHFKNKTEIQIEQQITDMQLYLENNYKDLAIQARKDATTLVEKAYEEKKIKEKSYQHYKALLEAYTKEMLHYNHQQFYKS